MSDLVIDTNRLRSSGQDIIKLSFELNEKINCLFSRISNINNTMEWSGKSANEFIKRVSNDKIQYVKIKNIIYNYGKTLTDISDEYEMQIKKIGVNFND